MKLFRFGDHGPEKMGVVRPDGSLGDASGTGVDLNAELIGKGTDALKKGLAGIAIPELDPGVRFAARTRERQSNA